MAGYAQGGVAKLQVTFLDQPNGQPVDPTAITLRILSGSTLLSGPHTFPGAIVRDLTGLFHYSWSVPSDLPLGSYTAEWTATVNAVQRTGYELFDVVEGFTVSPGTPDAWAVVPDVLAVTGVTVTDAQLSQAQGVVDLYAGVTAADAGLVSGRDRRLLRSAVCYQAAWLATQVDAFARTDVTTIDQDGVSATYRGPEALILAPLTQRSLARLSWQRPGSVRVRPSGLGGPAGLSVADREAAFLRDAEPVQAWRPLP